MGFPQRNFKASLTSVSHSNSPWLVVVVIEEALDEDAAPAIKWLIGITARRLFWVRFNKRN